MSRLPGTDNRSEIDHNRGMRPNWKRELTERTTDTEGAGVEQHLRSKRPGQKRWRSTRSKPHRPKP